MKYSQLLGVLACIALVAACYAPWSFVGERNLLITGMNAAVPDFGKPGLLHIILSIFLCAGFVIPKLWAKRTNVLVAALNMAWCIRNFLLMSACHGGECPQKKAGIYMVTVLSVFILLMTFLPPGKIAQQAQASN